MTAKTMTTYDILVKLYQRIQDPARWAGYEVPTRELVYLPDGTIKCGCVLQHLMDLSPNDMEWASFALRDAIKVMRQPGDEDFPYIGKFNDTHTHHEVLTMVHKAMELAESKS